MAASLPSLSLKKYANLLMVNKVSENALEIKLNKIRRDHAKFKHDVRLTESQIWNELFENDRDLKRSVATSYGDNLGRAKDTSIVEKKQDLPGTDRHDTQLKRRGLSLIDRPPGLLQRRGFSMMDRPPVLLQQRRGLCIHDRPNVLLERNKEFLTFKARVSSQLYKSHVTTQLTFADRYRREINKRKNQQSYEKILDRYSERKGEADC